MKMFENFSIDSAKCRKEVAALRSLLDRRLNLEESLHIRPFFRRRRHLSAYIASYNPDISSFNQIAFEYPLFGDFTCDLVVGDSGRHAYCFVEFEDAGPDSLFVKRGKKATREWSSRFDHGYSQIIDWFYKLEDMKKSNDFVARFGARTISYKGVLVIGRDRYLLPGEQDRLDWRRSNVIVASQNVQCVTFDRLAEDMQARLDNFAFTASGGG